MMKYFKMSTFKDLRCIYYNAVDEETYFCDIKCFRIITIIMTN